MNLNYYEINNLILEQEIFESTLKNVRLLTFENLYEISRKFPKIIGESLLPDDYLATMEEEISELINNNTFNALVFFNQDLSLRLKTIILNVNRTKELTEENKKEIKEKVQEFFSDKDSLIRNLEQTEEIQNKLKELKILKEVKESELKLKYEEINNLDIEIAKEKDRLNNVIDKNKSIMSIIGTNTDDYKEAIERINTFTNKLKEEVNTKIEKRNNLLESDIEDLNLYIQNNNLENIDNLDLVVPSIEEPKEKELVEENEENVTVEDNEEDMISNEIIGIHNRSDERVTDLAVIDAEIEEIENLENEENNEEIEPGKKRFLPTEKHAGSPKLIEYIKKHGGAILGIAAICALVAAAVFNPVMVGTSLVGGIVASELKEKVKSK